jgi:hypothetical protein
MTVRRKTLLATTLLLVTALHVALSAGGGTWRTLSKILILVDIISAWFFFAAIKETRKLEDAQPMEGEPGVSREQ